MDRGLDFKLTSPVEDQEPGRSPVGLNASSRNWFRLVVVGLALSNFLAGIFLEAENPFPPRFPFFAAVAIGLFPAQAGLLTLWLVWGPGRFGWRLLVHWLLILGFSLAFLAGYAVMLRGKVSALEILKNYGIGLSIVPPLSLGLQLSLWPFRVYGGWRVVRVDSARVIDDIQHGSRTAHDSRFATGNARGCSGLGRNSRRGRRSGC